MTKKPKPCSGLNRRNNFDPASFTSEAIRMDVATRARFDIDHAFSCSKMLTDSLHGRNYSWGIRWNWRVFRAGGMVLYPPKKSLVHNAGFDGSGSFFNERGTGWQLSKREVLKASAMGTVRSPVPCRVEPEPWLRLCNVLASF